MKLYLKNTEFTDLSFKLSFKYVKSENPIQVYYSPSICSSDAIGKLYPNNKVEILETSEIINKIDNANGEKISGKWVKIYFTHEYGNTGFILDTYLRKTKE